jgi:hypothetical protein
MYCCCVALCCNLLGGMGDEPEVSSVKFGDSMACSPDTNDHLVYCGKKITSEDHKSEDE